MWLLANNLAIPQTFQDCHQGEHHTWTHARGNTARLDYIVVDQERLMQPIATWVSNDIDLTTKRDDHQCVCSSITWTIWDHPQCHRPAPTPAIPCTDDITIPQWSHNVHDHAAHLQQWLRQFMPPQALPRGRKQHLQEATWQLIQRKKYHWKRIRQIGQVTRHQWKVVVFAAWKKQPKACPRLWLKTTAKEIAIHQHQFDQLASQVNQQVRADDRLFYEQHAQRTSEVAADEGIPGLWRTIKYQLPKAKAKMNSSLRCRGPEMHEVQSHFCNLEAGEQKSYSDLLSECAAHQADGCDEVPLTIPLNSVPTRIDIEQVVMMQKSHRAPGIDGITADVVKRATKTTSLPLFQLIFKTWVLGSEPLQFKGGLMHTIAKKQGGIQAHQMRGIMLLETTGKIFHSLVRRFLLRWSLPRRRACQFGGYPAQQTLYATQMLRAASRIYNQRGVSSGVLFIDIKAAFHSLIRELTFGVRSQLPAPLRRQLESEGLDPAQIEARIAMESATFTQSASPVLTRLLQETHHSTWFTLSNHDESYQTHRGSRPGSPLADLAFNTMMGSVLMKLEAELQEMPELQQIREQLNFDCPILAWVDDVAIPFATNCATQLDAVAVQILQKVNKVCALFGLRLNLSKGKTEALLQYRGLRANAKNHETFVENFGHIPLPPTDQQKDEDKDPGRLRVVSDYTYLGTEVTQSASLHLEIKTRIQKAKRVFNQLRKPIFTNRRLSIRARTLLLESLVVSIVMHGAGNWPLLNHRIFTKLSHVLLGWLRVVAGQGFWSEQNVPDYEITAKLGVPPLAIRLAKHRLLYACKWVQHAPQAAVDCVTGEDFDDKSWMTAVRKAIEWLSNMALGDHDPLPTTTTETYQWL